ncbi:MAG: hypothetical protein AAFW67_11160 [Cyanobacteria bacterium J06638_38]
MIFFYSTQSGSAIVQEAPAKNKKGLVVATYISGLGEPTAPITKGDELSRMFAPIVVEIGSTEQPPTIT